MSKVGKTQYFLEVSGYFVKGILASGKVEICDDVSEALIFDNEEEAFEGSCICEARGIENKVVRYLVEWTPLVSMVKEV